jgi:hypothetical protein
MSNKRKDLKKEYKQNHPPMGVYQIHNLANNKVLVGVALNLPGILNSNRLQLKMGIHPNKVLQAEWHDYGSESFSFEVLDELKATEAEGYDYREDLAFLEELWVEKLEPYGERGYNERKKEKEEKLRQIAKKRIGGQ